jgi:hypothetical protein
LLTGGSAPIDPHGRNGDAFRFFSFPVANAPHDPISKGIGAPDSASMDFVVLRSDFEEQWNRKERKDRQEAIAKHRRF